MDKNILLKSTTIGAAVFSGSLLWGVLMEQLGRLQQDGTFPSTSAIEIQNHGFLMNWQVALGELITSLEETDLGHYDAIVLSYGTRDFTSEGIVFNSQISNNPYYQPLPLNELIPTLHSLLDIDWRILNLNFVRRVELTPESLDYLAHTLNIEGLSPYVLINHTLNYSTSARVTNITNFIYTDYLFFVNDRPGFIASYFEVASATPRNTHVTQGAIDVAYAAQGDYPAFIMNTPTGAELGFEYDGERRVWEMPESFLKRVLGIA